MDDFIIHTVPGSPFARAVMASLEEKHRPWRIAPLAPAEMKQQPHLSRHPFGRMPVLEHGDFLLYETSAIIRYIDRVLPRPALTPTDPREAARMDQVMSVNDWYLFPGCANVIAFQRVVGPRLLGLTSDEAAIAEAMPRGYVVMRALSRLLGEQPFFAGDTISLADLHVAPQLDFLALTPEWGTLTEDTPNVVAWLERMSARPSMRETTWEKVAARARAAQFEPV